MIDIWTFALFLAISFIFAFLGFKFKFNPFIATSALLFLVCGAVSMTGITYNDKDFLISTVQFFNSTDNTTMTSYYYEPTSSTWIPGVPMSGLFLMLIVIGIVMFLEVFNRATAEKKKKQEQTESEL